MILNADEVLTFIKPYVLGWIGGVSAQRYPSLVARSPITFQAAAPTTGDWLRGDVCFNSTAAVGQPKGWQCTVAGTPGTWVSMGNL